MKSEIRIYFGYTYKKEAYPDSNSDIIELDKMLRKVIKNETFRSN